MNKEYTIEKPQLEDEASEIEVNEIQESQEAQQTEKSQDLSCINVPYIVYEGEIARQERYVTRLWKALLIAIVAVLLSNALWLYAWSRYDFESYEVSSEGGGNANYIGEDGLIINGESTREEAGAEEW